VSIGISIHADAQTFVAGVKAAQEQLRKCRADPSAIASNCGQQDRGRMIGQRLRPAAMTVDGRRHDARISHAILCVLNASEKDRRHLQPS
jgi:hypothetical protein